MEKEWIIEQLDFTSKSEIERNESLFTLGNGYLGLRGDLVYQNDIEKSGTYINGFYEKGPIKYGEKAYGYAENWQTMISIPEGKGFDFEVNGIKLFNSNGKFIVNKRILNMKQSCSIWTFTWEDENSIIYSGSLTTTIPFDLGGTVLYHWNIELPSDNMFINIDSSLCYPKPRDADDKDPRISANFNGQSINIYKDNFETHHKHLIISATGSELTLASEMDHSFNGVHVTSNHIIEKDNALITTIKGICEKNITINKAVTYSYGPSANRDKIQKRVVNELSKFRVQGYLKIIDKQNLFMDKFWSNSDIKIEGDTEAQISLRFNLFQLLQSVGRDGKRSIAAKGLSGPGYEGHYFWDAETYVLPFFIYSNPKIAKSMLLYRISILNKAKERAEVLGHDGILFPWRTINGEESSAYFPAGTAQYHINADVALGLVKYIEVTGDTEILELGGYDILSGTADFWCSLASDIPGKGICFNMVTGPDEYSALVDNNYYTNLTAKENLIQSAFWLKDTVSKDIVDRWKDIADRVFLPKDVEVTPQDDTFLQKEVWDFVNTDRSQHPLLLHFHPLNIYRKQVLKQADVVMAQALHRSHFSPGLMKRNFDYYEKLTTRDSSLSACAQGIVAFWLGYDDLCWEYFLETLHTDRKDLHNNVSHGLHTASMGGAYLMIINGFLGLENFNDTIRLRPRLPKELKSLKMNIILKGEKLNIDIVGDSITYSSTKNPISFYHYSQKVELGGKEARTFNTAPNINIEIDDINEESTSLERIIFNKIKERGSLPEECLIKTTNEERQKLYRSIGFKA